jgi:thioredoxin-like negative regulator of GroEL
MLRANTHFKEAAMPVTRRWPWVAALPFALAACAGQGLGVPGGMEAQYLQAREALEAGEYARANQLYGALLAEHGPRAERLRLEYAHSLLRAERYGEAARQATAAERGRTGALRASALAVRAAALHERARAAMAQDDYGAGTRETLSAALAALDAMDAELEGLLGRHARYDALAGVSRRRGAILQALSEIEARATGRG